MSARVRWGFLGTGRAARDFACGLSELPDAILHGVTARTPESAERFGRALGVADYGSIDALLQSKDIDIVYVATPNRFHREHCLAAIAAGKGVVCEKPFAPDAREAHEIRTAARRRGVFCMEAMWTRFLPAVRHAKQLVAAGAIGDVRWMSASLGHRLDPADWRLAAPEAGGGALLDLGVYAISLISHLMGKIERVTGTASIARSGLDEQVSATLAGANGAHALFSASLVCALPSDAIIAGTRGHLRIHPPLYRPERVSILDVPAESGIAAATHSRWRQRLQANSLVRGAHARLQRFTGSGWRTTVSPVSGNGYRYEAEEAMTCLRRGDLESPVMPLDETVRVLEIADSIRAAWTSGRGARPAALEAER